MIKKVIFYISIISFIFLSILVYEMLPFIYESGFQGILFLVFIIVMFISELYMLISGKDMIKSMCLNNIFIIISVVYVSFIYYYIYNVEDVLLSIDIQYFKNNYLVLSGVFLFIIINMIISYQSINQKGL